MLKSENNLRKRLKLEEGKISWMKNQVDRERQNGIVLGIKIAIQVMGFDLDRPPNINPYELRKESRIRKTYEYLREEGVPIHIDTIIDGIGLEPTLCNRDSLAGALNKLVRDGELFYRPEPFTYGLKENSEEFEMSRV